MRLLAFLVIPLTFVSIAAYLISTHPIPKTVFPNTYLSSALISGKTKFEVEKLLDGLSNTRVQIKINDKIYSYTYPKIGAMINRDEVLSSLFPADHMTFPNNYFSYIKSLIEKRNVTPKVYVTNAFDDFVTNAIFDQTAKNDEIKVDPDKKIVVYTDNKMQFKIKDEALKSQIINTFGKDTVLTPQTIRLENENINPALSYNDRLKNIFSDNVYIKTYDLDKNFTSTISSNDLKNIVDVTLDNENKPRFAVNQDLLKTFLNNFINGLGLSDKKPYVPDIISDFVSLVGKRYNGEKINLITAKIDYQPKTDGSRAPKYIEVDKGQETMYLFENGKLIDKHIVSTGLYYPTPVGEFKILNKADNAYSDIYNVWMPYWMAFYYSPVIHASFGIHELPYWFSNGSKITRPREFLGSPHTGGCISLDIGAAKKVYDWSDIGMPVYIFD